MPSTPGFKARDIERAMNEPCPEILLVGPMGQQVMITGGDDIITAALGANGQAWTVIATTAELRHAMQRAILEIDADRYDPWPAIFAAAAKILNIQKGLPS